MIGTTLARVALTALIALTGFGAGAQTAFEPAAVVNDRVITRYDIDQRARLLLVNGAPNSADLGRIALNQLTEDALKIDAAEAGGLSVSEDAVDAAVAEFAGRNNLSPSALDARLRQAGASRDALAHALRADLLWREVVRSRFGGRATPSEAEIDQEIELAAAGQAASYELAEIILPFAARGEAETRRLADQLARDLRAGGDFATAARRYSASASSRQGGAIGWVPERALPPQVAAEIAGLAAGAVTAPVETPNAIAILKVLDVRTEAAPWAQPSTVSLLALTGPDADALARGAEEVSSGAADCGAIAELAAALGLGVDRRAPVSSDALPSATRAAVASLPQGVPSAVVDAPSGPTVFIICDRAGGPDAAAREQLREQIRQQRLQNFAAAYLQELRADAVIEMR
jgi:peptidyl-prolyl cis-trans isomerase SurA